MKIIRAALRFLLSAVGLFFVVWPAVSLLFLSAVGLSILLLNVGPSVVEPIMNGIWPSGIVSISIAIVIVFAAVFVQRSCSLRRLGLFVLTAYSLTVVFGFVSLFVLGIFFDTTGPAPNVSTAANLTMDFVLSLVVLLFSYIISYGILYAHGYTRLKATTATTLNRQ